jgi:hypothetical protein
VRTPQICLLFALCGCNNPAMNAPDMAGGDMTMLPDGGTPDMAQPVTNLGTRIFTGKGLQLLAVTSDDDVAFSDGGGGIEVVPVAGGAATVVASSAQGLVSGKMVMAWANFSKTTSVGDLSVYTAANGVVALDVNSVGMGVAADDGSALIYSNNASGDGSTADLVFAKADGTGKKTLFPGSLMGNPCRPGIRTAAGSFFVSHCDAAPAAGPDGGSDDGGAPDGGGPAGPSATLSMVGADGTLTNIASGVTPVFNVSPDGMQVLAIAANGDGLLYPPTANASGTKLDSNVVFGFFSPDSSTLLYYTTDGKLHRMVGAGPSTVLVTSNVTGVLDAAPDFSTVLFYSTNDASMFTSDVYLASATTPGAATMLAPPNGAVYGDGYTADSSRVLFYKNVAMGVGDFLSAPASGGGNPTTHGSKVWVSYHGAKPTQVVFNPNWKSVANSNGRADVSVVDTAGSDPPTVICVAAEADFFLSHDRTKVVYGALAQPGKEGIYAAALP